MFEPSLDPVRDSELLVFDSRGKETRPFGGNNFTNEGYYFDFDHDGILDRADSTNYSVNQAPHDSVLVFELKSIEAKPRTLLQVIYNWHSSSAAKENDWGFTCFDDDQDGFVEIAFGPASATTAKEQRQIVFHWDPATKRYSAGAIPAHSHVRVMMPGETLASIAKSGGLGYPVTGDSSRSGSNKQAPPVPQGPYVFRSLKDLPPADIAAFFQGKHRRDTWLDSEDSFPNRISDGLMDLDPKQAALAIAEANRTPTHRKHWQLALDDRHDLAPPASGWLTHNWGSSGCYSYSSHLFALRFGVPDPCLIVFEYNSIGVVGRNPLADQPAHNVRVIKLSEKEARFLADTVFWLDRVRSFNPHKHDRYGMAVGSSADGFATLALMPDGAPPRKLAAKTVWATSGISARWQSGYDHSVFINLAELLIAEGFPAMLGKRWNIAPEIGHHSLMTPTEERVAPRVDADARQQLAESFTAILERNSKDPVPAIALRELAGAAGSEALTELLPALQGLLDSLPPLNAEDKEFATLEKRFQRDHFGAPLQDEPAEHKEAYARLEKLREQREFVLAAILRADLTFSINKLRLAGNPSGLMDEARANGPLSEWALGQLRRIDPAAWAGIVAGRFRTAKTEERRMILETLAAGHPPAAEQLIANSTPAGRLDLILEIARYHLKHDADAFAKDLPGLMSLARDKKRDAFRRGQAMILLAETKLPPDLLKEFTALLVAEVQQARQGKHGRDTLIPAVRAITRLPDAAAYLDLVSNSGIADEGYTVGFQAILSMAGDRPDISQRLAEFIHPLFKTCRGFLNEFFLHALAYDLRSLAPDIAAYATEGPALTDGDGADYSGGYFKSPVGQRYHIAREITALWSESDPLTRGRMWACFAASHPYEFDPDNKNSAIAKELRKLADNQIRALPDAQRADAINSAIALIPIPKYHAATTAWLRSVGQSKDR